MIAYSTKRLKHKNSHPGESILAHRCRESVPVCQAFDQTSYRIAWQNICRGLSDCFQHKDLQSKYLLFL